MLTVAIVVGILLLLIVVGSRQQAKEHAAASSSATESHEELQQERTYPVDLDSALWKDIKRRVIERDRSICRCCCGHAETAHHLDYDESTLTGESLERLVAVCNTCHYKIHFDVDGRKRGWKEVLTVSRQMLRDGKRRYSAFD